MTNRPRFFCLQRLYHISSCSLTPYQSSWSRTIEHTQVSSTSDSFCADKQYWIRNQSSHYFDICFNIKPILSVLCLNTSLLCYSSTHYCLFTLMSFHLSCPFPYITTIINIGLTYICKTVLACFTQNYYTKVVGYNSNVTVLLLLLNSMIIVRLTDINISL